MPGTSSSFQRRISRLARVCLLAPSQIGQIHPGADDNASGTPGVLELARLFAPLKGRLDRGILFMNFSGEELGLLGSAYWVKHPTLPLDKCAAMSTWT